MRVVTFCRQIGLHFLGFLSAWCLCSYLMEGPASIALQSLLIVLPGAVAASVVMLLIPKRPKGQAPPNHQGD